MAGKFEVYEDKAGKFRFRLKASNGQVVAVGEAYETKAAAKRGCEQVVKAADGAPIVDLTVDGVERPMTTRTDESPQREWWLVYLDGHEDAIAVKAERFSREGPSREGLTYPGRISFYDGDELVAEFAAFVGFARRDSVA